MNSFKMNEYQQEIFRQHLTIPKDIVNSKICRDCKTEKSIDQFYISASGSRDAHSSYCKPCCAIRVKLSKLKAKKENKYKPLSRIERVKRIKAGQKRWWKGLPK